MFRLLTDCFGSQPGRHVDFPHGVEEKKSLPNLSLRSCSEDQYRTHRAGELAQDVVYALLNTSRSDKCLQKHLDGII